MSKFLDNRYMQVIIALIIGIVIGAVFYPTKQIEERITKEYQKQITQTIDAHNKIVQQLSEEIKSTTEQSNKYEEELNSVISSYEKTIRELHSKVVEKTYKIIEPDGTIIEKTFKESETEEYNSYVKTIKEEFNSKIVSIEDKWMQIHKTRIEQIEQENKTVVNSLHQEILRLEKQTSSIINPKRYQIEAGYTTNYNTYIHSTYSIFGPIFIGAHGESKIGSSGISDISGGLGLGISF